MLYSGLGEGFYIPNPQQDQRRPKLHDLASLRGQIQQHSNVKPQRLLLDRRKNVNKMPKMPILAGHPKTLRIENPEHPDPAPEPLQTH
jgi:hypothetical protein